MKCVSKKGNLHIERLYWEKVSFFAHTFGVSAHIHECPHRGCGIHEALLVFEHRTT